MTAGADDVLSRVAKDRAAVYAALSLAFYLPAPDLVWDLRSGSCGRGIARAVAWLGPDADLYRAPIAELQELEQTLRRGPSRTCCASSGSSTPASTRAGEPAVLAFESEYFDSGDGESPGPLNGPSTARVARWLRESGFGPAADTATCPTTSPPSSSSSTRSRSTRRATGSRAGPTRPPGGAGRSTGSCAEHAGRWMPEFARRTLPPTPPLLPVDGGRARGPRGRGAGDPFDRSVLPWARADGPRPRD
ncbi:MAG: hypothetical protein U0838_02525 [Chloroflexota bacterium]